MELDGGWKNSITLERLNRITDNSMQDIIWLA